MKDKIESLRMKYEGFERGKESALAVRDEAQSVLEEAMKRGNPKILEEVEVMSVPLKQSSAHKGYIRNSLDRFLEVKATVYEGFGPCRWF